MKLRCLTIVGLMIPSFAWTSAETLPTANPSCITHQRVGQIDFPARYGTCYRDG